MLLMENCGFQLVHVGALEVQNVKRAINRYGTLPKGARIGAYLESLRQSGMPNQEQPAESDAPERATESQPQQRSLSPRQNQLRGQPVQMTRSNSSSGAVGTYQPPNSPRTRAISSRKPTENVLRTFRAPSTTTFRTASPSRAVQPTLADLEFPPPPSDLPPPPLESFPDICEPPPPPVSVSINNRSVTCAVSPIGRRKQTRSEKKSKDEVISSVWFKMIV